VTRKKREEQEGKEGAYMTLLRAHSFTWTITRSQCQLMWNLNSSRESVSLDTQVLCMLFNDVVSNWNCFRMESNKRLFMFGEFERTAVVVSFKLLRLSWHSFEVRDKFQTGYTVPQ
jgi:hypothetical protein